MDKAQAIDAFWNRFLPAYDENTVPSDIKMPYITYSVATDSLGGFLSMTASLWYRSDSWAEISRKAEEIAEYITKMNPPSIPLDNGRLYISKGLPFAQRMSEPSDSAVRRIVLQINAEFLTAY